MNINRIGNVLVIAGALGLASSVRAEENAARPAAGAEPAAQVQQPEPAPVFIRPAGIPEDRKTGLFIFLHGTGSSPKECAAVFQPLADAWHCSLFLPCGSRKCGLRPDGGATYDWNPAKDVPDILKAIRELKGIDTRGIFLMGFSSGAYMCYPLAFEQPGLFAGVIVFSGELPGEYRAGGNIAASARKVPFYLVHGKQDTRVPVAHAREARNYLVKRGFPVCLQIFPGRHFLPDNVFDIVKEAVDWFDRQGKAAPLPGKNPA